MAVDIGKFQAQIHDLFNSNREDFKHALVTIVENFHAQLSEDQGNSPPEKID